MVRKDARVNDVLPLLNENKEPHAIINPVLAIGNYMCNNPNDALPAATKVDLESSAFDYSNIELVKPEDKTESPTTKS